MSEELVDAKLMEVKVVSSSWDCDCCGYVYDKTATINFDGKEYVFEHDGHFGNGYWDGEDSTLYWMMLTIAHNQESFQLDTEHYTHFVGEPGTSCLNIEVRFGQVRFGDNIVEFDVNNEDHVYGWEDDQGATHHEISQDSVSLHVLHETLTKMGIVFMIEELST